MVFKSLQLSIPGFFYPVPNRCTLLYRAQIIEGEFIKTDWGDFNVEIDSIHQRARDLVQVLLDASGCTDTFLFGMIIIAAWARLRCYVVKIRLRAKRPINPAYPVELKTLGDHLRKTRVDRGLSQGCVASILQVDTDTVTSWEVNRHQPTAKIAKSIISFLRYVPFTFEGQSLGRQLYYARLITGHTQKQAAQLIGCDASNLRSIELDQRNPLTTTYEKIQDYIDSSLDR